MKATGYKIDELDLARCSCALAPRSRGLRRSQEDVDGRDAKCILTTALRRACLDHDDLLGLGALAATLVRIAAELRLVPDADQNAALHLELVVGIDRDLLAFGVVM